MNPGSVPGLALYNNACTNIFLHRSIRCDHNQ